MFKFCFILIFLISNQVIATGYDVFSLGMYDFKIDGTDTNKAKDYRYERRFDYTIYEIGPEKENFFYLKPFAGIEATSDSAYYFLAGIYLEDDLGTIFTGDNSNFFITPSIGVGYYDDGDGKKLGHNIEFRSTLEVSYQLQNKNRIGLSVGHISNANIADKNPGVEIISLSYQIPF
tara:strand:+ start:2275 stop:2802 length:528 start_codon:yes stop_codon:yes gene_type:complete